MSDTQEFYVLAPVKVTVRNGKVYATHTPTHEMMQNQFEKFGCYTRRDEAEHDLSFAKLRNNVYYGFTPVI